MKEKYIVELHPKMDLAIIKFSHCPLVVGEIPSFQSAIQAIKLNDERRGNGYVGHPYGEYWTPKLLGTKFSKIED